MKKPLLKTVLNISLRLLKILTVICIFSGIILANESRAQHLTDALISLDLEHVKITEAFRAIEHKTNLKFSYDKSLEENRATVSLHVNNTAVEKILDIIATQTGLVFRQEGNTIAVNARNIKKTATADEVSSVHSMIIQGTIKDAHTDELLPGVNILIKGTTQGTTTNSNGFFSIEVPDANSILVFSFIGYVTQEITVGNQTTIAIALSSDAQSLKEVVVIGYGEMNKGDLTTAVSSVKAKDLANQPVTSFDQAMIGKMAGLQISQTTGAPGGNINIRVRGVKSITAGNDPLYVIDGVPLSERIKNAPGGPNPASGASSYADQPLNPLSSINLNDIESIEVLKDASAAAIYGSRGSNGVVIITTKKGKSGKPVIAYDTYVGWQKVSKKIDMMDAYQYAALAWDAHNNTYLDATPSGTVNDPNSARPAAGQIPYEVLPYLDANTTAGFIANSGTSIPANILELMKPENRGKLVNTDWQNEIFRTAMMQSHNLSISGGKDHVNYFVSASYQKQDGVVISSGFKQYGLRANIEIKNNKLKVGVNVNPSVVKNDIVNGEGPWFDEGVIGNALAASPIFPVYNNDGSYNFGNNIWCCGQTTVVNPVALANEINDNLTQVRLLGNAYAEYELTDGLKYKLSAGTDINNYKRDYFRPSQTVEVAGLTGPQLPVGFSRSKLFINWLIEHTLSYNKVFGEHSIAAIAGFTSQMEREESNSVEGINFPNEYVQTLDNAGLITSGSSSAQEWSLISYLARIQYDYRGKYLLSASLRRDGSSRFGPGNKWGMFPSVSAGWKLSEEPFIKQINVFSNLKLRASYGLTGNFQINNYSQFSLVGTTSYVFGSSSTVVSGRVPGTAGNNTLGWEKTAMFDIGFESGFFNDKISLEVDYYNSNTSDLLLDVPVPALSGYGTQLQNIGKVNNKGIEVLLTTHSILGQLEIDNSFNISANRNTVVALGPDNAPIIATGGTGNTYFITQVGKPIGSYYTMVSDGVFNSADEITVANGFPGNSKPGDRKFVDVDKNGILSLDGDRKITGSYLPNYIFGFNSTFRYKGIDLGFAIQGVQGHEIFYLNNRYIYNSEGNFNNMVGVENRWKSPEDPGDGQVFRANRNAKGNNAVPTDQYIQDASFVRVRNITIGYNLSASVIGKAKLSRARLYVAVQNPFTFTKFKGYNPEINSRPGNALASGEDYNTYPLSKTLSIGANIAF
ncbi:TonB-dependent receptor [Ohtaekwangia koreensis]|uniref:TonB-linked outer membrane protein, SusC/RagA family n=1 Tax=Ohtaekwangia koreensis TaxID=688867 RepID=A0A1T5M4X7_9BACT|nr:TonB-dependent receptor [Ohtaekwangia koreensis]SKC83276.1 TonB-linked outer membrane protein, SusC/RagA family [Ohtaekwangia koreensis]